MGKHNKFNGITLKELRDIANKLPKLVDKGIPMRTFVSGATLSGFKEAPKMQNGDKFDPSKNYTVDSGHKDVNHLKNLKKYASKYGWNGVYRYMKIVMDTFSEISNPKTNKDEQQIEKESPTEGQETTGTEEVNQEITESSEATEETTENQP